MTRYFENEGDLVEQQYGDIVCQNFPNYYDFWNRFIKDPSLKSTIDEDKYNKLAALHYSLFFSLACAHHNLELLKLNKRSTKGELFQLLEFIETFYMHLGTACNRLEKFWDTLKDIIKYPQPKFHNYLKKQDIALYNDALKLENNVIKLRNSIVHAAQLLNRIDIKNNNIYLPDPQYITMKNENSWVELQKISFLKVDIKPKATDDLAEFEKVVNRIQKLAIENINKILQSKIKNEELKPQSVISNNPWAVSSCCAPINQSGIGISTVLGRPASGASAIKPDKPKK
ncbi:MAG: hypothetical protein V1871_00235 [Planctomycetota bacterium]